MILNQAFALYFSVLGGSYAAYKTLGLFLMLMTWFYCLAVILVLGVELNAFLGGHGGAVQKEVVAMQALMAVPPVPDHQARRRGHRPSPCNRPGRRRRVCGWRLERRTSTASQ